MSTSKTAKGYKGIGMDGLIATWYTKITRKNLDQFRRDARKVADSVPEGAAVLEVAPGPGFLAIELAKLGRYAITGLDISAKFVEIAQANAQAEGVTIDFRQGDVAQMPFEDAVFDFIICTSAFKNFAEPVKALDEMHRVLKPGGTALIIDLRGDVTPEMMNQYVDENLHLAGINALFTKWTFKYTLIKRAYTKDKFEKLVSKSAFKIGRIQEDTVALDVWLPK